MQQLNQLSTGAQCLSVLITKSRSISFWSLAMKPIVSVFSFSHWGSTQLTNKRAKKVACFIFTNTWTYILYKLFGSIFTIKYILRSEKPIQTLCVFLSLEICEPPDLFLSPRHLKDSKEHYLRCSTWDARSMFLLFGSWRSFRSTTYAALPSTHSYFLISIHHASPLSKRGNW